MRRDQEKLSTMTDEDLIDHLGRVLAAELLATLGDIEMSRVAGAAVVLAIRTGDGTIVAPVASTRALDGLDEGRAALRFAACLAGAAEEIRDAVGIVADEAPDGDDPAWRAIEARRWPG